MSERRPKTEAELVELVRAVDVRAPESLRANVEEMIADRTRTGDARGRGFARRARPPLVLAGAIATAAAVLAVALLAGGSSAPTGPTVSEAAALTLAPATHPAPPESPTRRAQLAATVDGVSFPYWEGRLGWRSTGSRSDRLHGRQITTVFYDDDGATRAERRGRCGQGSAASQDERAGVDGGRPGEGAGAGQCQGAGAGLGQLVGDRPGGRAPERAAGKECPRAASLPARHEARPFDV